MSLKSAFASALADRIAKDGWTMEDVATLLKRSGWNEEQTRDVLTAVREELEPSDGS